YVNYKFILISIICGALAIIRRGLRGVFIIESLGYKASNKNCIHTVAVGYLTNLLIPRAGEISRCTSLQQVEKIPFDKLFGTIILERLIDLAILIILVFITFTYKFAEISLFFEKVLGADSSANSNNTLLIILGVFGAIFLFTQLFQKRLSKFSLFQKIKKITNGLKDGLASFNNLKEKTPFIIHTIFIWVMYIIMTFICFFAIEETKHLNILDGIYITIIGGLGMIVPSQGGIGSYHLAVKIGLNGIGIAMQPALLFAFAVHTAQTLMTIIFGLFSSFILLSTKKNVEKTK
ncbi:MAG: flippase-like domain-containing protein, partial [Pelagibacterales bacterium]|nr:flippase-like domain-containing protein [Pelagibacterales bacterium]